MPDTDQPGEQEHRADWRRKVLYHHRIRSHLSNERRYLGWLGVSVALISLGFVVERVDLFLARLGGIDPSPLPSLLSWAPPLIFGMGMLMIVIASWEFLADRRRIAREQSRRSVLLVVLVWMTLLTLVAVAGLLLEVYPVHLSGAP